ncbi:uncharacterized protein M6B38_288920 [Iris pallida]|uniref:Uncharacterized protein n=1 Tax=Iris pallida TaxID=29817 RepID=A0AAX6HWE6_IRIPA|nr:uncharacterized protein M6B38_288920 [Iris pallida]
MVEAGLLSKLPQLMRDKAFAKDQHSRGSSSPSPLVKTQYPLQSSHFLPFLVGSSTTTTRPPATKSTNKRSHPVQPLHEARQHQTHSRKWRGALAPESTVDLHEPQERVRGSPRDSGQPGGVHDRKEGRRERPLFRGRLGRSWHGMTSPDARSSPPTCSWSSRTGARRRRGRGCHRRRGRGRSCPASSSWLCWGAPREEEGAQAAAWWSRTRGGRGWECTRVRRRESVFVRAIRR